MDTQVTRRQVCGGIISYRRSVPVRGIACCRACGGIGGTMDRRITARATPGTPTSGAGGISIGGAAARRLSPPDASVDRLTLGACAVMSQCAALPPQHTHHATGL